jgi:hypothetical protein
LDTTKRLYELPRWQSPVQSDPALKVEVSEEIHSLNGNAAVELVEMAGQIKESNGRCGGRGII